jgi:hypothetical protein
VDHLLAPLDAPKVLEPADAACELGIDEPEHVVPRHWLSRPPFVRRAAAPVSRGICRLAKRIARQDQRMAVGRARRHANDSDTLVETLSFLVRG